METPKLQIIAAGHRSTTVKTVADTFINGYGDQISLYVNRRELMSWTENYNVKLDVKSIYEDLLMDTFKNCMTTRECATAHSQ